jgi:hypothetical protein
MKIICKRCLRIIRSSFRTSTTNLVDPASSYTLVSRIKPCMFKYKLFTTKLRIAHYNGYNLVDGQLLYG